MDDASPPWLSSEISSDPIAYARAASTSAAVGGTAASRPSS